MSIKTCMSCVHFKEEQTQHPQHGNWVKMALCFHEDCRDVVDGSPIPAIAARQQPVYCTFQARYYKEKPKEESEKVISLIQS